jgi:transcriptional regulator with XRE-family HTH domain
MFARDLGMENKQDAQLAERIGKQLQRIRGRMSQADLLSAAGEGDPSYLSEIENGKTEVSVRILKRYVEACDWTLAQFFAEVDKQP